MIDVVGRTRRLVSLAASGDTAEARSAASMARRQVAQLDTELLDTLAGQRSQLLEALRAEYARLLNPRERATKTDTGDLVAAAMLLLGHYERVDVLLPVVLLLRVESGHQLTDDERQQLDGPQGSSVLDQWARSRRERRAAERAQRRAARTTGRG